MFCSNASSTCENFLAIQILLSFFYLLYFYKSFSCSRTIYLVWRKDYNDIEIIIGMHIQKNNKKTL